MNDNPFWNWLAEQQAQTAANAQMNRQQAEDWHARMAAGLPSTPHGMPEIPAEEPPPAPAPRPAPRQSLAQQADAGIARARGAAKAPATGVVPRTGDAYKQAVAEEYMKRVEASPRLATYRAMEGAVGGGRDVGLAPVIDEPPQREEPLPMPPPYTRQGLAMKGGPIAPLEPLQLKMPEMPQQSRYAAASPPDTAAKARSDEATLALAGAAGATDNTKAAEKKTEDADKKKKIAEAISKGLLGYGQGLMSAQVPDFMGTGRRF